MVSNVQIQRCACTYLELSRGILGYRQGADGKRDTEDGEDEKAVDGRHGSAERVVS